MLGPEFAKFSKQARDYHFDSFPYENSYEEEPYEDHYKIIAYNEKWGPKYAYDIKSQSKYNQSNRQSPGLSPRYQSSQQYQKSSPSLKSNSSYNNSGNNSNTSIYKPKKKNLNIKLIIKNLLLPNKYNPLKRTTFISILPIEVTMKIISYLPFEDIVSIQYVCSDWYQITREEILWKIIYQNYFQCYPNRELFLKKSDKSKDLHWREIFRQQHDREQKWKGDRFKEAHLIGHTGTVWALHLDEDRVFTGSFDKTAKVWDAKTKKCRFTLSGHYYPIQCLDAKDDIMVTGSLDNSIRLWDLGQGKSKGILTTRAHNFDVFCLQMVDNTIISGSSDSTVKVWNIQDILNDNEPEAPLTPEEEDELMDPFFHQSCVTCLQVYDNILMSGGSDKVVRVWDLNTSQPIQVVQGHNEGIRALQFKGNVLVTGSDDMTCKLWDLRSKSCNISTLRGHNGAIRCLQWDGTTLITGSNDQTVRWWNLNYDSSQSKELFSFSSSISCLKFTDNILMCGLSDSKVQIIY
ncbi:hypothetical protein DICPUDRAFT_57126 [Dictyostelium purpureum]|uniref:F-box domain-containing protein n=1 Tax=Dictyostelium purpureum TaxID=5786 RepID=F0ZUF7_DICPU|nr:uncharacterized protein DICPUDRAFT_57126 [Dictyostelium purpureum]EGC32439.1 hypothetical protein DICPUDRAFT_57126 [Dictyostelium purpureum]|eukprot:XP_003291051.1 hypothetical protein DICPUDRAFT_57126 [Dictyostelium purpureum]